MNIYCCFFFYWFTEVQKKFSDLQQHMKTVHEKLQTGLAARKVHESDLQKLERWCKEADMKCAVQPPLDCATEILQEQYKQYKVNLLEPDILTIKYTYNVINICRAHWSSGSVFDCRLRGPCLA